MTIELASKSEKVADIICEMREAHGVDCRDWADRIEASHNEQVTLLETAIKKSFAECSQLRKRLKVAEGALEELRDRLVASVHDGTIDPYESLEIAENALAAIREEGGAK